MESTTFGKQVTECFPLLDSYGTSWECKRNFVWSCISFKTVPYIICRIHNTISTSSINLYFYHNNCRRTKVFHFFVNVWLSIQYTYMHIEGERETLWKMTEKANSNLENLIDPKKSEFISNLLIKRGSWYANLWAPDVLKKPSLAGSQHIGSQRES